MLKFHFYNRCDWIEEKKANVWKLLRKLFLTSHSHILLHIFTVSYECWESKWKVEKVARMLRKYLQGFILLRCLDKKIFQRSRWMRCNIFQAFSVDWINSPEGDDVLSRILRTDVSGCNFKPLPGLIIVRVPNEWNNPLAFNWLHSWFFHLEGMFRKYNRFSNFRFIN